MRDIKVRPAAILGLYSELGGMVVEEKYRGKGVGTTLVLAAEDWARRHSVTRMRVHSQMKREKAHLFYERLGYELQKTSKVFTKAI